MSQDSFVTTPISIASSRLLAMVGHVEQGARYDVVVVGVGLQGLAAAKTYLQIEPQTSLLIVDSNQSIGGVWARENIYPGLRSNNLLGTYEYTDFPMHAEFGVKKGEHIPGEVLTEYFRQYAEKFELTQRTLLGSKLTTAERIEDGWKLSITSAEKLAGGSCNITCSKLIIATGLTSSPIPINIEGQEKFSAPVINFAHFRQEAAQLLEDRSIGHVAVYGGSKSAYDTVYMLASHGKRVSWIIRASGHGYVRSYDRNLILLHGTAVSFTCRSQNPNNSVLQTYFETQDHADKVLLTSLSP